VIGNWFNAREATELGAALADQYARRKDSSPAGHGKPAQRDARDPLQEILDRVDREVRALALNFYKKAKFANSFKWRLLENGVERELADKVTERLVLHLSRNDTAGADAMAAPTHPPPSRNIRYLLVQGNRCIAQGAYGEAIALYEELLELNPNHPEALNNLGAAFFKVGRIGEAELVFRRAVQIQPNYADANSNLGNVLRNRRGRITEAEMWLRSAIKLNPKHLDARNNLGLALSFLGRLVDAKAQFKKVLKIAPLNADALFGMGQAAAIEGSFVEAESLFKRALQVNPKLPSAFAAVATLRKMKPADAVWLEGAEQIAAGGIAPLDEANMRFAIAKYFDDIGDFSHAFQNYKRANELQKSSAEDYERDQRKVFVNDLMRVYTRETLAHVDPLASDSMKPVFVVGMPRSGTSLAEQIIASHPSAKGAGELGYWTNEMQNHDAALRQGLLVESTRKKLAEGYLRALEARSGDALRIVDKAPVNADFLGVIHSVFPNARIIYMQRDPIDTCLSCYFQKFSADLEFAMDLSDLAHYYREHQRLMAHWRAVLPPGTILDLPYAGLVADQEGWTRKILEFLDLEWNEGCLDFHKTQRAVVTASYWQVRQPIYKDSVARWRNYEKFIGPLLALKDKPGG
jgi:tetratricopeptide (TPR) repeat protein